MGIETFLQNAWIWFVSFIQNIIPQYILPNLRLILLTVGLLILAYIVGRIFKIIVVKILSVVGLKRITKRSWTESILKITGYKGTIVELIGDLVKWLIYILFLIVVVSIIPGLSGVANIFTQIAVFIPKFIGALLIVVVAFIIADFLGKVFEEAARHFLNEEILSRLSGGLIKYSIGLVGIIMGLSLIGLDTVSLTVLFASVLAVMIIMLIIGIRDIFPNVTAGMYLKKILKPGMKVKIGEYDGVVKHVGEFSIIIIKGKKTITIPNSMLIKKAIETERK